MSTPYAGFAAGKRRLDKPPEFGYSHGVQCVPAADGAMNFDFSDEQRLLRDQARRFLDEIGSPDAARKILEGDSPFDRALWDGMAELGWMGTAIPEEFGGIGLSHEDLCVIAEELGRSLAPTPFSSSSKPVTVWFSRTTSGRTPRARSSRAAHTQGARRA